jgi:glycosyltransferase involved in cell wall biosynthesis
VPILYSADKDFQLSPKDIIVIPEDYREALEALREINIKKYIFCQNHFYIFKGLRKDTTWADLDIDVFCSSEIIRKFLQSVFDYDGVPVIHCAIHLELFKPRKKKLQIAYMPRKRPAELDFIRNLFNRLYKQYKEVPWICIDKVNDAKVAEILSESAIYFSTSLYEGFGLPPIEAMACGCIVVGFHGGGGLEYASSENGYWCEEGDIIECVRTLGHVVSLIDNNDEKVNKVRNRALKKAGEYTFDRQEGELLDFWSKAYK